MDGKNGYLGMVAKAGSSYVEGKKEKDLVSRLEGEAVKAMGAKLMGGDTAQPKSVGHLLNRVSTWQQDRYGNSGSYSYENRNTGYNNNPRGGYNGSKPFDTPGYGGDAQWNTINGNPRGGYNGSKPFDSRGYGGDAQWNTINGNKPYDTRQQGYYDNNTYDGYGNRGKIYNGWNNNPSMSPAGYGYP